MHCFAVKCKKLPSPCETLMMLYVVQGTEERNHDLVQVYKTYFERHVNPTNLALFIDSYIRRTDLNIVRELEPSKRKNSSTLSMPVMNITGALSPHVEDTVTLNGRLDPTNSTWMKVRYCDYFEIKIYFSRTSILRCHKHTENKCCVVSCVQKL